MHFEPGNLNTKKFLKIIAVVTVFLAAIILGTIYYATAVTMNDFDFFSRAVLHPFVFPKEAYDIEPVPGIKKVSLFIPCADGAKMHALYFKKPGADKLVIVNHGAGGNLLGRVYIAQSAALAGASTLLYDYRGYAQSTGKFNLDTILEDGLTAYDYANKKLGYPANKIIECGESIGSAVASQTAVKRPCAGVLMLCGVTRLPAAVRKIFPIFWIFPDAIFAKNKINNLETIQNVHAPILFIHGKLDAQVPYQGSEEMFAKASKPKQLVLLPDCGHDDLGRKDAEQFQKAMDDFLSESKN